MAKTTKLVDPIQIFRAGAEFEYSCRILGSKAIEHLETGALKLPTSCVSNALGGFAIELYIKYHIRVETNANPPTQGHDLAKYFALLSQSLQQKIKNIYYQSGLSSDPEIARLFAADPTKELHFNDDLMLARNCFAGWRYVYEGGVYPGHIHPDFLELFRESITMIDPQCKAIWEAFPP